MPCTTDGKATQSAGSKTVKTQHQPHRTKTDKTTSPISNGGDHSGPSLATARGGRHEASLQPQPPSYLPLADLCPGNSKSLAGIATRAFCLGMALSASTLLLLASFLLPSSSLPSSSPGETPSSPLWRLPFFLAALSLFHFLEFYTTAAYNTPAAGVEAFLLTANWPSYAIAHAFAAFETLVACFLHPAPYAPFGLHPLLVAGGLFCVVVGQTVRSLAMVTAGRSFNHLVQEHKADSHTLVTSGIYAWFRHPSYFGFFWWAIGTQLVMGNVISFVGYAFVLWKFFSTRIQHEEEYLVRFFGRDYEEYRRRVGTRMPFCG